MSIEINNIIQQFERIASCDNECSLSHYLSENTLSIYITTWDKNVLRKIQKFTSYTAYEFMMLVNRKNNMLKITFTINL